MRLTPLSAANEQTPAPQCHSALLAWQLERRRPIAYNARKSASVAGRGAAPTHFCSAKIATALHSPSTASQDTVHIRSASVRLRLLRRPSVRLTQIGRAHV